LNKKLYLGFACSILSLLLLLPFLTFALADPEAAGNWPMPGRDPGGTRYSPLTQVTPANVSQLKVAWVYHMKPPGTASLHPSEDQPLVVGSTMFVATPYSQVVALDSATGREQWMFQIPNGDQASIRGAAYWPGGEGAAPAIIFGSRHGLLYSISAATGQLNQEFGDHGIVDLKTPGSCTPA
jgi:quinoprotein glucose dehydrogenase